MRVLVTGAMGFIGSHVAEFYAKDPNNKLCLIDNLSRHSHNIFLFDEYDNVEVWQADLRDFKTLNMIIKSFKPEVIIHAAGQTAVTTSITDPQGDFSNNVIGTFNLLESLRINGLKPKFIFTSTNKVYGENVNKLMLIEQPKRYDLRYEEGINEQMRVGATRHTPYGTSKLAADLYVQEYGKTYGIASTIFRMSCIYGTRQFGIEDQGWVSHFVFKALNRETINIYGDGKQVRDILYISDLVSVIDKCVKFDGTLSETVFNIGGGASNSISLLNLIDILEYLIGEKIKVKFHAWRASDQRVYISDTSRASTLLKWEPLVKVKEGIQKTFDWVKAYLENTLP